MDRQAEPHTHIGEQTIPMNRFFMVITASGIARGRVRMMTTTTAKESRKMVADRLTETYSLSL